MNLYKIGDTVINMDRVNGIQDHQAPTDPSAGRPDCRPRPV